MCYYFQHEEQATDETTEQFEERVLNKRAAQFYKIVRAKMQHMDKLYLSDLTHGSNRKQVNFFIVTISILD